MEGDVTREELRAYCMTGRTGVDCIETGGPEPGRGRAGVVLNKMLQVVEQTLGFLPQNGIVMNDVLGDVVGGGFAIPMRGGRFCEIHIIAGFDVASTCAANHIVRAVSNNGRTGARLKGIVVHRAIPETGLSLPSLERLAARLGTRVVGVLSKDPLLMRALPWVRRFSRGFPRVSDGPGLPGSEGPD